MATATHNTAESTREATPAQCPHTGNLLFSWLRLDNARNLARSLGMDDRATDSDLVLAAYRTWGDEFVERLSGDFALALFDAQASALILARDVIGTRPIFYSADDSIITFATTAAAFPDCPWVDTSVSQEWMAWAISSGAPPTLTAFTGVKRLAAGHLLRAGAEGVAVRRYHRFTPTQPWASRRSDRWLLEYRQALRMAVHRRLRSDYPIGAEVTGGIDSSAIVGLIPHLRPEVMESTRLFGFANDDAETELIPTMARAGRFPRCHVLTAHALADDLNQQLATWQQRAWTVQGYPMAVSIAYWNTPLFELAQRFGVRTLLSGFGGDQVVSTKARLALDEAVSHRDPAAALRLAMSPQAVAKSLARQVGYRRPAPKQSSILKPEVAQAFSITPPPPAADCNTQSLEHLEGSFLASRLENCSLLGASFGLEYRWPLLDAELVATFLATPTIEKAARSMDRYLHRRAIEPWLPPEIVWRRKGADRPRRPAAVEFRPQDFPALLESHQVSELIDFDSMRHANHSFHLAAANQIALWLAR